MDTLTFALALAAAFGVLSHVGYFRHGEHHLYGAIYVQGYLSVIGASVLILCHYGESVREASTLVVQVVAAYATGLYLSLVTYRAFLHPLNKFPGPFGARISSFYLSASLKDADAFRKLKKLHDKYGDFVRVGSSDLSISHPKAVQAVYGPGSKCSKAAWYDLTQPMVSLQTYRIKSLHDQRRRLWSTAFSDKALRSYEERIQGYRKKLFAQIDCFGGLPVNVTKWFNLYSFDVMGDLAFGTSFNMLDASDEHWAIKLLNEGIEPLAWMFPLWFFRIMTAIPGLTRNWWRFIDYCAMRVEQRRQNIPEIPDIMSTLLSPLDGKVLKGQDLDLLTGDAQLIVVAGSDTTAATLTHIMLELCRHPEHVTKLRTELEPYLDGAEILHSSIFDLEHLNGVIYETLRLHPPVPSALQRKTPPEGLQIGDTHVAGNMTVWCPQYVIGRKEEIYTHADTFVPERWYLYPYMVKEKGAWAPFSAGPYGCIGKPLALLNIRTTVARIISLYDISFAPASTDMGRDCEASSREHFTLAPGELHICFKKRRT